MTLKYAILVSGSPYSSQAHMSAQRFIYACYQQGHTVNSVFFYGDGVYVANQLLSPANDEFQTQREWQQLANNFKVPLHACVTVANKRGILSAEDSELLGQNFHNLAKSFEISGLGSWVTAAATADRQIHFS
ncbi:MAG: sulfurtransferase complex subunit TusD [Gammaproteobacteria bacterium]|nr:sulfurtransferase complex subunit TusD [Gammaproteobacteria bacterium]